MSPRDIDDLSFIDMLVLADTSKHWLEQSGGLGG